MFDELAERIRSLEGQSGREPSRKGDSLRGLEF